MQKGMYTTEFWLTVLGLLVSTVLLVMDKITSEMFVTILSIVIPGYSVARGIAKINTPHSEKDSDHSEVIN